MRHRSTSTATKVPQRAFDTSLLVCVVIWLVFGLIMLSSASGPSAYAKFKDAFWFVKHQILYGLLPGVALLIFFSRLEYRRLRTIAPLLLFVSIGLLISVFLPGVGATWGTSRSWIHVLGFSFQPAEVVKLTFLIFLAAWLEKRGEEVQDVSKGVIPFLCLIGVVTFLLMLQPDTGGMVIIVGTSILLFFLAGARLSHLFSLVLLGLGGMVLLIKAAPYRLARFTTFLHPELDPKGIGYHINQALLAIGSGGIFGLGFGNSRQKFLYLPEVEGDSIFAIMAEEMGFVTVVAFIALLLFFLFRGLKVARGISDPFGRYLAAGIVSWLTLQAFVNIASMLSLLPLTGLTLPFVSYGGTSLMANLAAVGVLLSLSRHSHLASDSGIRKSA